MERCSRNNVPLALDTPAPLAYPHPRPQVEGIDFAEGFCLAALAVWEAYQESKA